MSDAMKVSESVTVEKVPASDDSCTLAGYGVVEVFGADGEVKQSVPFRNIVTDTGDLYYAAKAITGIGPAAPAAPTAVTGMQIGSGTTVAAKNGVGAAMVTFLAGQAFDAGHPTTNNLGAGLGVEAVYKTTYAAGTGTGTVAEVTITNGPVTTASTATNTISRVVLGTAVSKASGDSVAVTYRTKFLG